MLRSRLILSAVALSAALALSACGGDDESVSVPTAPVSTPTTQTAPTVTTPTQTAPPTQTTTTQTTTAPGDPGSGGTEAPSGSGGTSSDDPDNQRAKDQFQKFCDENPDACND